MPAKKNELYLTFDDGPVPGPTEFALEELHKVYAKATFFCIGDNVRKYPAVFKSIVKEGHTIGNHTFNHLSGWKTSTDNYLDNIRKLDTLLSSMKESAPNLFRPPYGKITPSQIRALRAYRIVMWDVLTKDYDRSLSSESCLRNSIAAARPGSIIVFHDSYKAENNLRFVLPRLISHFAERGYTFKALPS